MSKRMMAAVVMAAMLCITTGFAQAAGVGHISAVPIGPALMNRSGGGDSVWAGRTQAQPKADMKSSEYQGREAMETGNLPESKGIESNETSIPAEEIGGRLDRKGVDTGP